MFGNFEPGSGCGLGAITATHPVTPVDASVLPAPHPVSVASLGPVYAQVAAMRAGVAGPSGPPRAINPTHAYYLGGVALGLWPDTPEGAATYARFTGVNRSALALTDPRRVEWSRWLMALTRAVTGPEAGPFQALNRRGVPITGAVLDAMGDAVASTADAYLTAHPIVTAPVTAAPPPVLDPHRLLGTKPEYVTHADLPTKGFGVRYWDVYADGKRVLRSPWELWTGTVTYPSNVPGVIVRRETAYPDPADQADFADLKRNINPSTGDFVPVVIQGTPLAATPFRDLIATTPSIAAPAPPPTVKPYTDLAVPGGPPSSGSQPIIPPGQVPVETVTGALVPGGTGAGQSPDAVEVPMEDEPRTAGVDVGSVAAGGTVALLGGLVVLFLLGSRRRK